MTDAERKAVEWLEEIADAGLCNDRAPARTLKAMLARQVLPKEPSDAALKAMYESYAGACMCGANPIKGAYRALYAHLTAPKTKTETFVRWLVVNPRDELGPYAIHSEAVRIAVARGGTVIELTGKGEIPT